MRRNRELFELLYRELRTMADRRMGAERVGHTLQPTALVHEAFLKMDRERVQPENREQFLALAARAMRRVLVDHVRRKKAEKRGGELARVTLDPELAREARSLLDVDPLDLDRALEKLGRLDERQERVVELRFLAGATTAECARLLGVSASTVEREWRMARAWLAVELRKARRGDSGRR